jgi:hypothetical protein
VEDR